MYVCNCICMYSVYINRATYGAILLLYYFIFVCMYNYNEYVCTYVCMYICMYDVILVCIYVCIYVYIVCSYNILLCTIVVMVYLEWDCYQHTQ